MTDTTVQLKTIIKLTGDNVVISKEVYDALVLKASMLDKATSEPNDLLPMLKEAGELLAFVTYHDNRYRQSDNYEKFQRPASRLADRIGKVLNIDFYDQLTK